MRNIALRAPYLHDGLLATVGVAATIYLPQRAISLFSETRVHQRDAEEMNHAADEASLAILALQDSAQKVTDVTDLVEDRAFQTGILAINAAVEAARADEAGKGFAIVAQEVRSLAMRSSEAAKMIAAQTAESVSQIGIGAGKVQGSREALGRIKTGIDGLHAAMLNIDEASRAQLASFLGLAGTITELDKETQINAKLAQDSVVAASDLDAHADRLQEQMALFHLNPAGNIAARYAAE